MATYEHVERNIFRRGRIYWVSFVDHRGKQRFKSTRLKGVRDGKNLNDARRVLADCESDTNKGIPVTAALGKLPFSEALKDVERDQESNERRALDSTTRRIKLHIGPFFEGYRIGEITTTQIRTYVAGRKKSGAQPATINRELAIIRRAFKLAHRAGHILTIPHVELLDESRNVRQGIIEPHDFAKVLTAMTPEAYAAAAETAFITGWRLRSEVLTLQWAQVDLSGGTLRIDPGVTKGGEGRTFPITTRLQKILQQRKKQDVMSRTLVFHERDGSAIKAKRFYTSWRAACASAKVGKLIPHDLRRSAVREMERRHIPRQVSMKLIGHRTESIYRRYAIVSEADIMDAGSRLDQPAHDPRMTLLLHSKKAAGARTPKIRRITQRNGAGGGSRTLTGR